ncbi:hypothetical protein [Psychrobacter sp. ANT_WB68]|uniref:hypothetical protein n=1 Tax=Psychrobacter sp. ANT_WB68 TaxID=2597355 RepID=UPI0011F0D411|nr:hypothetical protein [Psychrobacter sp. ANT_WB68]KAA0914286.1 hypothetical protein FQ084_06855 [Psychrobacter sp. ANT_WB68]
MRLPDINDLIQDLQLAKQIAIDDRNPNAIVTATMSQSKLLGLDKPQLKDVEPIANRPTVIRLVAPKVDENERIIKS